MSNRIDEIQDDELRVIGGPSGSRKTVKKRFRFWGIMAGIAVVFAAVGVYRSLLHNENEVQGVFEQSLVSEVPALSYENIAPIGDYSNTTGKANTEHVETIVNDIPLDVYIPHNARPILSIGVPDVNDSTIVFATQAADIRADNGKIVGAFVLSGEPLSWGLSKKGFVGIIGDDITIGVAENSPLFEEATEKGGYFFRQYPLVDNGKLVENEPKGKSIRKAICDRNGEIIIVMSQTRESFHDFAQALVDLQVKNAVYLVGADSYGLYRKENDSVPIIFNTSDENHKYVNYIIWVDKKALVSKIIH